MKGTHEGKFLPFICLHVGLSCVAFSTLIMPNCDHLPHELVFSHAPEANFSPAELRSRFRVLIPRPKGTTPRENIALGKFSVACKCIFISNHHLFLQCTTCLSGGIQQHSNTQTQDQTSDSKGLGSRYKCMCIFQVECVLVSILSSKNYYFNGQLFMKAQRNIRCYICK